MISDLDPGIRDTVLWLINRGFETTDSGDGKSKPESERVFHDEPHVFMRCDPEWLAYESSRLRALLRDRGVDVRAGMIQASYDPVDGIGVIALIGVTL